MKPYLLTPKALIRDAAGQCLLVQRAADLKTWPGLWDLPGGKPHPGETLDATLRREVHEETGLAISLGDALAVAQHDLDHARIVFLLFAAEPTGNAVVRLNPEHTDLRWLPPAAMVTMPLVPPTARLLRAAGFADAASGDA